MPHINNHKLIYEACIEKDRKKVYKAFRNDPNINSRLDNRTIRSLVDEMIDNTSKYTDL